MYRNLFKITYIQLFFMLTLIFTFLPSGIIYSSSQAEVVRKIIYVIQLVIYMITIEICFKKKSIRKLVNSCMIPFECWTALLIVVTYIVSGDFYKTVRGGIYCLGIIAIFLSIQVMAQQGDIKMFKMFYNYFSVLNILNVLSAFIFINGIYNYSWHGATYMYGGKFTTFYMYYTWVCLYGIKNRAKSFTWYIIPLFIGWCLCIRINCSTGIACIIFTIVCFFTRGMIKKIKPWILITTVIGITLGIVLTDIIFNNSIIVTFITEVLHRSSLMTGRVEIYENFLNIISDYKWFGAGYDNTIITEGTTRGYLNAQNGILDIITKTGVLGLTLFIMTIYNIWNKGYKLFSTTENNFVEIFVLGFFFCAMVEISFNYYFYLLMAFIPINIESLIKMNQQKRRFSFQIR